MDFVPAAVDATRLQAYAALMKACFPGTTKFDLAYLQWLYAANPDGIVLGYDAFEGDRLAAHYACIPAVAQLEGQNGRVILSLNTATHPDFQGRGLFTKLADRTYEAGRVAGFDAVYGVANANSTPGFTRKLGFQLVAPLEARVGVGRLFAAGDSTVPALAFRRTRTEAAMQWRCGNPHNVVQVYRKGPISQCFAAARGSAIVAYHEFEPAQAAGAQAAAYGAPMARVFLGLAPQSRKLGAAYISIPQRLRPSPLNLIYKPLSGRVESLDRDRIEFSFLDFDAY